MKVIMYGAEICSDCIEAKAKLEADNTIELDFRNITGSTTTLKEFLSYRDHDEIFAPVIRAGRIGIPFFILEDNTKNFEINDFIDKKETVLNGNTCSIDGKGC